MANPTRIPIGPSGEPLESDNIDDVLTYLGGGEWEGRPTNNAVESVFGRTGAVVAQSGDYNTSQVTNNSGVFGSTASDALIAVNASGLFHWGAVASSGTTANRFFLRTFATVSATETQGQISAGRACTIRGIRVTAAVSSPTDSITFTLRINGASSLVTCTLPAGQTTVEAVGFSVNVAAGDRLSMMFAQSGTDTVSTWNVDVVVF